MPGTVMTIHSNVMNTTLGNYHLALAEFVRQQAVVEEQALTMKYLFAERNFEGRSGVAFGGTTAIDKIAPIGENGEPHVASYQEVEPTELFYKRWSQSITITDDLIEKGNLDEAGNVVKQLTSAYYAGIQDFAERLYCAALMGKASFSIEGHGFSTAVRDGLPLFATNHPYADSGLAQSNKFTNGLTQQGLDAITTEMQNFQGDTGNILGISPQTIIIPNDAALKNQAFTAVGSKGYSEDNRNAMYWQFGMYNVVVLRYAATILKKMGWTGPLPYIVADTKFLENFSTAVFGNFKPHRVKSIRDEKRERVDYVSSAQFNARFNMWQYVAAGNCPTGTTLEEPIVAPLRVMTVAAG